MILIPVLNNISLLVTLSVAFVLTIRYFDQTTRSIQVFNGFLFGGFVILGMYNSVEMAPGLIFDGRSIILSVAGLFGGPLTAVIAFLMSLGYRVWIGGPGVVMGALVIAESTMAGIFFHYLLRNNSGIPRNTVYLIMSMLVHVVMLVLVMFLPGNLRVEVFLNILVPVLVVYPVALYLVCVLFSSQLQYLSTVSELQESEERFRELFYESRLVYMIIDPASGIIVNHNKAAEKFYGYSTMELDSSNISMINILPPEEIKRRMKLVSEEKNSGFIMKHKLSSGEIRDVEVFSGPVRYKGKQYLYSIINDITDRVKTENRLKESELSYRGLFDAVKDSIYIQRMDGVFVDVNAGAEKMYNYKREEFIGKTPEFLSAPGMNDLQQLEENYKRAFRGESAEFEYWGKRSNGQIFPKYMRLFKGKYFGEDVIIAIGHDITHRKQAQKELEESRSELKALINVSGDLIVLLDSMGVIITHNKTFSDQYPSAKGHTGRSIFEILPPEIREERRKYFDSVLQARKPVSFEENSPGKNWWVTYYPIVDEKFNVHRMALYARDVTDQRKLFDMQKNLHVAEKSAQLRQQFLANMSHEMRTPMNGILGMTGMLDKTPLTDVQKDYLETIRESSNTLLLLINDILDLARFESGKIPLNLDRVNLIELQRKVNSLFKQSAQQKGLSFSIKFSPLLPAVIVADERKLMQVIINLMGNALKFTHQGSITLKADLINRKEGFITIRFCVTDTGIGIDKDFHANVFEEFVQSDNSPTRKYEGSGLGLAISKKIVEFMGGTIGVDSQKGRGSRFWFTVIAREASDIPEEKPSVKSADDYKPLNLNVLMVEDKVINRKVASLILAHMGCNVDVAENGQIGVEKILNNRYDVVLMDIQMPVMDGLTAVQTVRKGMKNPPWIIGLSAEAMEGDAEKYISQGMDDYITKPLIPEVLYEKLESLKVRLRNSDNRRPVS